jgi:septum formation protein
LAIRFDLILASSSPRRLELLRQIGVSPDRIESPDIDETPRRGELPRQHAARLACDKAGGVTLRLGPQAGFVLAADTVVACGRRILPKAQSEAEARACLRLLSGRRHRVFGGICVVAPDGRRAARVVATVVELKRLSDSEVEAYLASGEWHGKAGGYAIQGRAAALIPSINGSYANVVGLPLVETMGLLHGLGWRAP